MMNHDAASIRRVTDRAKSGSSDESRAVKPIKRMHSTKHSIKGLSARNGALDFAKTSIFRRQSGMSARRTSSVYPPAPMRN